MNTRKKIVVVGSGYVGMSLATMLSNKHEVCVLDIDESRVQAINDRKSTIRDNDIDEMLVKSTILHGKLTEVVKQAENEKSDKGIQISKLEKKEIMEAIKNLEDKIMKIKITVDQK